jgi:hypothetical protein
VSSGREAHGKENPRKLYAVGLRTEPAPLVRGSSRRITIMRFRPANIRVINRRNSRLDRDSRCFPRRKKGKNKKVLDWSFHISTLPDARSHRGVSGGEELLARPVKPRRWPPAVAADALCKFNCGKRRF